MSLQTTLRIKSKLWWSNRPTSRYKSSWNHVDWKSKMAITAIILKIHFWYLLLNHSAIWVETYTVAIKWLVDQKYIKFCRSEIQDSHHSSHVENHFAMLKTNFWHWSIWVETYTVARTLVHLSWNLHSSNKIISRSEIQDHHRGHLV